MLSPADDADGGTVHYLYTALINVNIEERAKRMVRAAQAN